jgi:hypothetical protein
MLRRVLYWHKVELFLRLTFLEDFPEHEHNILSYIIDCYTAGETRRPNKLRAIGRSKPMTE